MFCWVWDLVQFTYILQGYFIGHWDSHKILSVPMKQLWRTQRTIVCESTMINQYNIPEYTVYSYFQYS